LSKTVERIASRAREAGLDAVVCFSPDSVSYTIGFMVPSHPRNRHRHAISVVTADGDAAVIVVTVEESITRDNVSMKDVRSYNEFTDDPMVVLADTLREKGVAGGKVGIQLSYLFARDYLRLVEHLPKAEIVDCESLMDAVRAIKTEDEIEIIRQGAMIAEKCYERVRREARGGMTEQEVATLVMSTLIAEGVEYPRMVLGSGPRAAYINAKATTRRLETGDIVRFDVLGAYKNYQIDIARTATVGPASAEQKSYWSKLVAAQERCIKRIKPGVSTRDIYLGFLSDFREFGIDATLNFVGHGLGISTHEEPYINKYASNILEENMVLCVEPVHLLPGIGGYHLEDAMVVRRDGAEVLSNFELARNLIEIKP